jgi:phosphate transport system substrate-binding protein
LPYVQIDNGAGAVALTDETAAKAVGDAKFAGDGMDLVLDMNSIFGSKAGGAYPLVLVTYEIVCSKGYDADTGAAVKSFLSVAANQGQANLSAAGYVPLPDSLRERLLASLNAIAQLIRRPTGRW